MLGERKIAKSYAIALFDLALEKQVLDEVNKDMVFLGKLLAESQDLVKVLASPIIRRGKKADILKAIVFPYVHDLTQRFLLLLVKSLRVLYLSDIAVHFISDYKAHKGIRIVRVRSVIPLPDDSRAVLVKLMTETLKSEIELEETLDPRLIGGLVVQVDDLRFDGSLKSKLNKLSRQFDINIYQKGF